MKPSRAAAIGLACVGGALAARYFAKPRYTFAGKHAVITGGSRGLGLALARELTLRGARVSLIARDEAQLAKAVADLRQRGGDAEAFVADLTAGVALSDDGVEDLQASLVERIARQRGPIDVLVNNAGTILVGPVQTLTMTALRGVMELNFIAAARLTLAVAPTMAKRGGGRIINVASVGGKLPVPHLAAYSASKFALNGFFGAARGDLRRDGIVVTTVNPGLMRTGSTGNAIVQGDHEKEYAWFTLGDSLPGVSMSAAGAARKIIEAAAAGKAEATIGLPALLPARLYGIAPNFVLGLAGMAAFLLPKGTDAQSRRGSEVESALTRSKLTLLTQRARADLNQSP